MTVPPQDATTTGEVSMAEQWAAVRRERDRRTVGSAAVLVFLLAAWFTLFFLARSQSTPALAFGIAALVGSFFLFGWILCVEFGVRPIVVLLAMIVAFSLQNVFLGFVTGDEMIQFQGQVLIGLKTLYVGMLCSFVLGLVVRGERTVRLQAVDIAGFVMIGYVAISFLRSDFPLMAKVTNVRQFVVPIMLYLAARFMPVDKEDLHNYLRFLLGFGVLLAAVGFIERFAIEDGLLFRVANMEKITLAKIGREEIPGTLWTDLGSLRHFRRLVSVFYEPINAGYFFGAVAVIAAARRRVVITVITSIATFLTFAKAAWALLAAAFGIFLLQHFRSRRVRWAGYLLIVLGYVVGVYLTAVVVASSTTQHLIGLASGLMAAVQEPFGHGIGSGGYFSWIFGVTTDPVAARQFGSDSGIGSIGQQLGMVGIVFYLTWLGLLLKGLEQATRKVESVLTPRDPVRLTALVAFALTFGLTLNVFLQENALSIYANYITLTLAGITLTLVQSTATNDGAEPATPNAPARPPS